MGRKCLLEEEQWLEQLRHKDADDCCHMPHKLEMYKNPVK